MTLIKWKPENDLFTSSMRTLMNSGFNDSWNFESKSKSHWLPSTDINETDSSYSLTMDIPGLTKSDIKIVISDGFLVISGKRKEKNISKDEFYNYVERKNGSFERKFNINELINEDKVSAKVKDGMLKVQLPKIEKAVPSQKDIKIN